ncbi:hypothetical protein [Carboxydothermus hydrogenoformans]|uniref:Uncharacterized protein n=1 Tax=Carboxydothermus hydrogenoformans (strain ATCC BAA-161 / DSM 6008 / Z-2901) TaxID=246194 RepID=Q3ABI7_CARHZ|nr:hypothetical protein [Carboxydothermus hydrogenoformans]ABB15421.1 hypothetical protein CHY_1677 [Carboxydothermus hydrogenoformans Z-2901]
MDNDKLIKDYELFVKGEWDLSPFEHIYELNGRDIIEERMSTFSDDEKEKVKEYDKILVERAPLFYKVLKGFLEAEQKNKPKTHWWWYLNEVVEGKLNPQVN